MSQKDDEANLIPVYEHPVEHKEAIEAFSKIARYWKDNGDTDHIRCEPETPLETVGDFIGEGIGFLWSFVIVRDFEKNQSQKAQAEVKPIYSPVEELTPAKAVLRYLEHIAIEYRLDLVQDLEDAISSDQTLRAMLIKEQLMYNSVEIDNYRDLLSDSEGEDDAWLHKFVAGLMEPLEPSKTESAEGT